jgi:hypothetical protein
VYGWIIGLLKHFEIIYHAFVLISAELLTTNKFSELACLALYLMYEKKQGKKSFWYPYIRELDRQRGRGQLAVESPLLWSESELEYLAGSPLKVFSSLPPLLINDEHCPCY